MQPPDESALIDRVGRGDRAAMGQLLRLHERRLYNICLRMVSNRDDAAELTQDAMVKIVQNLGAFRGEAKLTTWMTRIAMNQSISFLRRRRLRDHASLDAPAGEGDDQLRTALVARLADTREPQPEQRVQQAEDIGAMHRAMAELDDDHRAVLVLRDLEGLDYPRIAAVLELPVGTVKSRLFRARLELRQRMHPAPAPVASHSSRAPHTPAAEA